MSVAQLALRGILRSSPEGLAGRAALKASIATRAWILRRRDPLVRHRVGEIELLLPLSHELPFYLEDHPAYGRAVGRIARELGGPVVDVGANVGDTAALIRLETEVPILCVEGDERFFALLERNAARLAPVELERAFVEGPPFGRVERAAGTARILSGDEPLPSSSLEAILDRHPRFREPALVKIDTDGMDVPIILASLALLERTRPVLFFEYDPHLGAHPSVFERLREIGYRLLDVYENTGEYVRTVELPGDVHEEYLGHDGSRYADVCVRR